MAGQRTHDTVFVATSEKSFPLSVRAGRRVVRLPSVQPSHLRRIASLAFTPSVLPIHLVLLPPRFCGAELARAHGFLFSAALLRRGPTKQQPILQFFRAASSPPSHYPLVAVSWPGKAAAAAAATFGRPASSKYWEFNRKSRSDWAPGGVWSPNFF